MPAPKKSKTGRTIQNSRKSSGGKSSSGKSGLAKSGTGKSANKFGRNKTSSAKASSGKNHQGQKFSGDKKRSTSRFGASGGNPAHRRSDFPLFAGKRLQPSVKSLEKLLDHYGVELKKEPLEQLWAFHQLLRENNHDQDLTRLNAFETMVERHYADCILLNALVQEWPERMIDVGSGAGFPGFPLKITNPQIHLTLCEPRPRRVEFLELVIRELGLKNIDVFGHKVTSKSMTIPVEGMISRAFERIEKTLPRMENSIQPGGRLFFMKGPAVKEELQTLQTTDYIVENSHFYRIPHSTQDRALVILRRK